MVDWACASVAVAIRKSDASIANAKAHRRGWTMVIMGMRAKTEGLKD
jgi:hypothetical protein